MGEYKIASHADIVLGCPLQIHFGPGEIVLGMALHPDMIETGMIGHEIEHEPEPALFESLAYPGKHRIATQAAMDCVIGDREAGTGDVILLQVRQSVLELSAPFRIGTRYALSCQAGLPVTEEPRPVEAHRSYAVQRGI